jgi:thioredoxin reductase
MIGSEHDTDVAVIGAGPYGLSLAAHLRPRRVAFRVFGGAMRSWRRNMPSGMFLKSEGFASSIADPAGRHSLARFCAEAERDYGDYGVPVEIGTFVDYGRWFQQALVPDVEDVDVRLVRRGRSGFELALEDGRTLRARRVVVACGFPRFRHVPPELGELPAGLVSHTSDHHDFSSFAGKDVLVVGAGQSALESAALLLEHGASPRVVVRRSGLAWTSPPEVGRRALHKRLRWPISGLGAGWPSWACAELPRGFHALPRSRRLRIVGRLLGPSGAWWLRPRLEGSVPVLTGHSLVESRAENGGVRLTLSANGSGRTEVVTERVLAATGYRVDVDRLEFLDSELRAALKRVGGAPDLSSSFESSVRGLYFIGLASANSFGPVMRFVCGTRFASRRLSRRLADARRQMR